MYEARMLRGIRAIAAYIGCSPQTVNRYIEEGLPAAKTGAIWVTSPAVIDMWILSKHDLDVRTKLELRMLRRLRAGAMQRYITRPDGQIEDHSDGL